MLIALDTETTGINPYSSEIIEAFFKRLDNGDIYYYKARPLKWGYEAENIHSISYSKAMSYPHKHEALKDLLDWLPNNFKFLTHVNKNTELGYLNFDTAILENELNLVGYPFYYLKKNKKYKGNISNIDIARKAYNSGLITLPKGDSGRVTYKLEALYKHLFGSTFNAHSCKDDVEAMLRIYNYLIRLLDENRDIFTWNKAD